MEIKYIKAHRWLYSKPNTNNVINKPLFKDNVVFGADWVNGCWNIQQCWDLGAVLYNVMNGNGIKSNI